jgi:uncharacterized membrane protein
MNLFQLMSLVGLLGGAMAGIAYGKHHGPWGPLLGGVLGGVVGFIGGIIITPVVILFGHTVDIIERKLRPSLNKIPNQKSTKDDSNDGSDE